LVLTHVYLNVHGRKHQDFLAVAQCQHNLERGLFHVVIKQNMVKEYPHRCPVMDEDCFLPRAEALGEEVPSL